MSFVRQQELREVMADPIYWTGHDGAPLTPPPNKSADENADDNPTLEDFALDFKRFPRTSENMPAWIPKAASAGDTASLIKVNAAKIAVLC